MSWQAEKLGHEASEANGQPYYPIYLFSPFKLLTVIIGCAVSFIWVIFPSPITAKSRVPKLTGQGLFNLGRLYSAMHATIELWITSHQNPSAPGTTRSVAYPQEELRAIVADLYKKQVKSLEALKMHSHFASYEPPVGGKFPARIYDGMIAATQQSLSIVALMAHIGRTISSESSRRSASTSDTGPAESTNEWVSNLAAAALSSTDFQSHTTTALLCHLGSSMMNGQPLPPFLTVSEPFPLAKQLQRLNFELLHIRNAKYPAFVAFIALEVLRTTFSNELKLLLE